jgi:hypothetical protein
MYPFTAMTGVRCRWTSSRNASVIIEIGVAVAACLTVEVDAAAIGG